MLKNHTYNLENLGVELRSDCRIPVHKEALRFRHKLHVNSKRFHIFPVQLTAPLSSEEAHVFAFLSARRVEIAAVKIGLKYEQ